MVSPYGRGLRIEGRWVRPLPCPPNHTSCDPPSLHRFILLNKPDRPSPRPASLKLLAQLPINQIDPLRSRQDGGRPQSARSCCVDSRFEALAQTPGRCGLRTRTSAAASERGPPRRDCLMRDDRGRLEGLIPILLEPVVYAAVNGEI